jgi:hypothetical protein
MHRAIHVQAPSTSYGLVFRHLRGEVKLLPPTNKPKLVYVSGGREYNHWQVVQLMMELTTQLPQGGHTLATGVYLYPSLDYKADEYEHAGVAIVPGPNHRVTKHQLRRAALTEAVADLPAVDRAYFHLILSELEGRDMQPILRKVLHRRKRTNWIQLVHHVVATENPLLTHVGE